MEIDTRLASNDAPPARWDWQGPTRRSTGHRASQHETDCRGPCCAYPCRCCRLHNPAGTALGRKLDVKRPTSSVRNPVNFRECAISLSVSSVSPCGKPCATVCAALNVAERKLATGLGVTVVSTSIANACLRSAILTRLISLSRARVQTRTEWPAIVSLCSSVISQPIETAAHRASSLAQAVAPRSRSPARSMVLDRPLFVGEISNVDGELI